MAKRTVHNATITLKLPIGMDTGAQVCALRAAGIPVDAEGNAREGFLFVRSGIGLKSQASIFRWFAGEVRHDRHGGDSAPPRHEPIAAPPASHMLDLWLAHTLPESIHHHSNPLQCEPQPVGYSQT